jgi:hypothetical protein
VRKCASRISRTTPQRIGRALVLTRCQVRRSVIVSSDRLHESGSRRRVARPSSWAGGVAGLVFGAAGAMNDWFPIKPSSGGRGSTGRSQSSAAGYT